MDMLRDKLPLIMMALAVIIVIALGIYSYTRDDEEEDEDDLESGSTMKMSGSHSASTLELPESDDMRARKSRMIALKDSLERSLQTRGGVKASGGIDRLAMPWFMLVGSEGSGKKSLLASTGLPLPYGAPVEVDGSKKDAGRWWLFEEAVVVEAPTVKPSPKASAPSDSTASTSMLNVDTSEGWNNLLHLLRRERPDSPLNGIVVAISCADLVGSRRKSPEELSEQAELMKAFLDRTRRVLGIRLPVHVLITRCDVIPGFRSFAETLPEPRRDDVFGWANPRPLEKPFESSWIESGFTSLQASLESLHDELLAAPENIHDADGLFVFVNEFSDLQDPLVDYITRLMPQGERRPSFFLRSVSFTGDPSEKAARAASESDDNATLHISLEAAEAESHSLVFLRSLFVDKIFKEAGLARTGSPIRISRDIKVLGAQAAAMLIALLGGAGLWASLYGFQSGPRTYGAALTPNASETARLMSGVAIDLDQVKRRAAVPDTMLARRVQDAAVINLLNEMRTVSSRHLRSVFVPSSWLSPLPKKVHRTVLDGIQNVVLPIARQRLQGRVDNLLGTAGQKSSLPDELDASNPMSLASYLGEVRKLNLNVARYNALANQDSAAVKDLADLVEYLFGEQLPLDTTSVSEEFVEALRVAEAPPLNITPAQTSAAVVRAVRLVTAVSDTSVSQLTGRGSSRPEDDLRALRRLRDLIELTDPKTGLAGAIRDRSPSGTRLARMVQDSITARFTTASIRIFGDTLLPDQASQRMRTMLGGLFSMKLMEPAENKSIATDLMPGTMLRWDLGKLDVAFALRGELQRAQIMANDAFAPATRARLRSAFDAQLRTRLTDVIANAEGFIADSLAPDAALRVLAENIQGASERLTRLASLLDSLSLSGESRKLVAMGARQSEHALGLAQVVVDSAEYLTPHPMVVAAWSGGVPIGFAAMGVSDSGAFNLRMTREHIPAMATLARDVQPALDFLRLPVVTSAMITSPKLVADWRGIVAGSALDPASSLGLLYSYIQTTMGPIDQAGCQAAALRPDPARTAPADWYAARRVQFRAALLGRCHPGGSGDALAAYRTLRTVFTEKLAGRFPFVDSARASRAADADPAAVREFYRLYDAFARSNEVMLRSDRRAGPGARPAFAFLDLVRQSRPFVAAFVDSGVSRTTPAYGVVIEPVAGGGELHLGSQVLLLGDSTQAGEWRFGEPISLVPLGETQPSFQSRRGWGIVELGRRVKVRYYNPDTKVRIKPPVFPTVAPDIPIPGR